MQGDAYEDSSWIRNEATFTMPSALNTLGEHYIIFYSCHKEQTNNNDYEWNCHGSKNNPREYWQLIVINVNETNNQPPSGGGESTQPSEPDEIEEPSEPQDPDEIEEPNNPAELDEPSICNCDVGHYCANNVCLMSVSGNTYFVAPDGDDLGGDGSYENPWASFHKAVDVSEPGDITYFRGGVYYPESTISITLNRHSGTPNNLIRYYNYPGERPIFNGEHLPTSAGQQRYGFRIYSDNLYFKGLTMRNIKQLEWEDKAIGFSLFTSSNVTFEHVESHNIMGRGFHLWNSENITFINVDSYNNGDPLRDTPGNGGTGWTVGADYEMEGPINFYGCRSWNNSDGGFQGGQRGLSVYENCWSWDHGYYSAGDGHGFKLGWISDDIEPLSRHVTNCISVYNARSGFHENSYDGKEPPQYSFNGEWFQNTAYKNGWWGFMGGFTTLGDNENTYSNNIAYDNNQVSNSNDAWFQFGYFGSHNTWDTKVKMSDEDFIMLPLTLEEAYAVLGAPRHPNGSLPDIGDYFKLAETSEFIDLGMIIPGYHCPTNGSYPSTECAEWRGYAPDPGAFESPFTAQIPHLVDECRTLANPNGEYILTDDISSLNTCFSFAADNITLDCDGHTITYGTAGNANSRGINIDDYGVIVKNCVIVDGNMASTNGERQGIRLTLASNTRLENNTVTTDDQRAIYLYQSSYNTLVGNKAMADSQVSIALIDAHHNVLQDNTAQSTASSGFMLFNAHNNEITRIVAKGSGSDIFVSGSNNNTFTDCNVDDGVTRINEGSGSQDNVYVNCSG
jgi:parallel beta-helix repeat protein